MKSKIPALIFLIALMLALALPVLAAPEGQLAATPTEDPYQQTATPQPDGSILHEVLPGQSFQSIATLYGIWVSELLEMNRLTSDSMIFPGDLLLVRPAYTPTPSPTVTLTPTPVIPTATRRPTRTATQPPLPTATPQASPTPTAQPLFRAPDLGVFMSRGLPAIAAGLAATGLVMILAGSILKRRR